MREVEDSLVLVEGESVALANDIATSRASSNGAPKHIRLTVTRNIQIHMSCNREWDRNIKTDTKTEDREKERKLGYG